MMDGGEDYTRWKPTAELRLLRTANPAPLADDVRLQQKWVNLIDETEWRNVPVAVEDTH